MLPDRTFDWVPQHDPRSLDYPIRDVIRSAVEDKPKRWRTGAVLDQGREGSCVGHGWTGELLASPRPYKTDSETGHRYAVDVYKNAQLIDEWPGEDYSGTSVLAGAKVLRERGHINEYRWAFGVDDVRDAVIAAGPVVLGIPWYDSMYQTKESGLVETGGTLVGGHCILITGYHPGMRIRGEDWNARYRVFRWRNSWGPGYGLSGDGLILYEDLRDLLADRGEACIPTSRNKVKLLV